MTDRLSPERRSWNMAQVRHKDTKPELAVRRMLHGKGYRFRLHRKDLPGTPDIVLPRYKTVVFVNGCFWHRHGGCPEATMPKTRTDFWRGKFDENVARDRRNHAALRALGWKVHVVWECETTAMELLAERLETTLRRSIGGVK